MIVVGLVAAMFINCLLFTYFNAIPLVKSDGWRFIQIYLVPWFEGTLQWSDLWSDHHPQPLTAALFIANAELFGLRMDYEALIAIVFLLLLYLLFLKKIRDTLGRNGGDTALYVLALLVAALLFSLTSVNVYIWSLVTLSYIAIFFCVLALGIIDAKFDANNNLRQLTLSALGLALVLIMFSTVAQVFVYAFLAVSILKLSVTDKRKAEGLKILSIILAMVLQQAFFALMDDGGKYSGRALFTTLLANHEHWGDHIRYIGIGFLSAWLNVSAASKVLGVPAEAFGSIGLVIIALYAITLVAFFKTGLAARSAIPGTLILVSAITALGGAAFRFKPETQSFTIAAAPRYYPLYCMAAIGCLWTWTWILSRKLQPIHSRLVATVAVALMMGSQLASTAAAWKQSVFVRKLIVDSEAVMRRNQLGDMSVEPSLSLVGSNYPEPYLKGLSFLADHHLNLFHGESPFRSYRMPIGSVRRQ